MLILDWNMEDALAVRYEKSIEKGIKATAQKALSKGFSVDEIQDITGLDKEAIMNLKQ